MWIVCCNGDPHAVHFAFYLYVYFYTFSLMFVSYIRIVGLLGQIVLQTSAGINLMPGVVRVVDGSAYSPLTRPCFAGLHEQSFVLSRAQSR